jgi:hypothetical protein
MLLPTVVPEKTLQESVPVELLEDKLLTSHHSEELIKLFISLPEVPENPLSEPLKLTVNALLMKL